MVRKLAIFIAVFIVCSLAFLPVSTVAVTTTIQPSSQDSTLVLIAPNSNYGGTYNLAVGTYLSTPLRTLVQFDLSIPAGSTITSATLKLYYYTWSGSNPVGRTYWAYRVTQSWIEWAVTWNKYDGVNPWATAGGGGDYTPTGGASATVPSSYGWMTWTVTAIVKAWVEGGEPNYGFLIKDETEYNYYEAFFYSREYTDNTALCPILEVTYTPPIVPGVPELSLPLVAVVSTAAIILFLHKRKPSPTPTH